MFEAGLPKSCRPKSCRPKSCRAKSCRAKLNVSADAPAGVGVAPRTGALPGVAARIEHFFVTYRDALGLVHVTMFVVFVAMLFGPLVLGPAPEGAAPLEHFSAFTNFAIWTVWFPLVFLSVIFTGRSWCGLLCPMGAASEWANARGLQRRIPGWVKWPGTPIISFVIVTIWAQTAGARDHGTATAIVFGGVLVAAIVLGFLYGRDKRAWCRHMCPIGLLLGVYSRIGAVDFRPKRPRPGGDAWTERGACPTMIDLNRKTESRHCIECFRCVNPNAKGGLYLSLRRPATEVAMVRDHHANLAEVLFLFIGTGTALGGFLWLVLDSYGALRQALGNWIIDQGWYWLGEPGPIWLMAAYPEAREVFCWFDFFLITGYMLAWTALIVTLLSALTAFAAWGSGKAGGTGPYRARFVELGYQFLPIAMVSLLLGLGGGLFEGLGMLGLGEDAVRALRIALLVGGGVWSITLGYRLLARQAVPGPRRWLPMLPGITGSLLVGAAWYPAILAT